MIHARSARADRAMIRLNCAAIPRELVDSELFGHERGAFTGAVQKRRGRFELADGGTLFLDEVGELPLEVQPKLLRVLQEGEFERVGGERSLRCDVRVIAATNRNLHAAVQSGRFRDDLFYRLNVFPITLPPLRERREDIPALLRHFAASCARRLGRPMPALTQSFFDAAMRETWPGNVRELEYWVERAMIAASNDTLEAGLRTDTNVPATLPATPPDAITLQAVERQHIERVLARANGRIEGEGGAAAMLGLNASTLRGRMRRLSIRRPS